MQCQALRNIPKTKRDVELQQLDYDFEDISKRSIMKKAFMRYYEANIPVKYWRLEMSNFSGDKNLLKLYNDLTKDFHKLYKDGANICLAGQYGLGKTMVVSNILKKAVAKNYSGLYVNLGDVVSSMKSKESYMARKELLNTDFLVIDEFDPRYMATEAASDFYGRVLEDILRNRTQNKLPIFMCTNSPNPVGVFNGSIQESISSLMNYVNVVPVLGQDYRKKEGNNV